MEEYAFSRTRRLLGAEAMRRLENARVAVFGIGGVGGHAVEALARSGVGALDLIDSDRVVLSNLNRQIIATRDTIGRPPIQYVKHYRVQKAAELLTSTALKIGQIAERCGFQDDTYFIRSFREIKGMTPAKYRAAY